MYQPIPILLLALFTTYQAVVNTVRALSEKSVHYPFSIPFVKWRIAMDFPSRLPTPLRCGFG